MPATGSHRRVRVISGLCALFLVVLTACGGGRDDGGGATATTAPRDAASPEWQKVVDAAVAEGSVTLYSFQAQDRLDALKQAFEKAYPGITLNVSRLAASEGPPKLEAERTTSSAGADVYMDPRMVWAQGQLATDANRLVDPEGPAVAANEHALRDECRCVIAGFTAVGIGWNTTFVPTGPTTLDDVVDPKYKGKVALPDIEVGNASYYAQLVKYKGRSYWDKLAAQNPKFYAGGTPVSQGVIAGEAVVTPFAGPVQFGVAKDKGAPVEFALPKDAPPWGPPFLTHILGWAKHPNAAHVLVDFIMTKDGQAALNARGLTALKTAVPGTIGTFDDAAPYTGDMPQAEVDALMADFRKTFRR